MTHTERLPPITRPRTGAPSHAPAMYAIGYYYESGLGVKQDDIEAMRWYRKAADKGDPEAKAALERLRDK